MKKQLLLIMLLISSVTMTGGKFDHVYDLNNLKKSEYHRTTVYQKIYTFLTTTRKPLSKEDYQRVIGSLPLNALIILSMIQDQDAPKPRAKL